jgi:ribosomal protein L24E
MNGPMASEKLQSFVHRLPAPVEERCVLCGGTIEPGHEHLVAARTGTLLCACIACALLLPVRKNARFKRVPRRLLRLPEGVLVGEVRPGLPVPMDLAFYFQSSASGRAVAVYPGPAGPTPAPVDPGAWQRMSEAWPILRTLEPDVEGLLVHGSGQARDAFLAPIDLCYELVGRLRLLWRGPSGGDLVRDEIRSFFKRLRERAQSCTEGVAHA